MSSNCLVICMGFPASSKPVFIVAVLLAVFIFSTYPKFSFINFSP